MPQSLFDPMPEVHVTYEDGSKEMLFTYYPDEIHFSPEDFITLSREDAFTLYHAKDSTYLRS